MAPPKLYSPRHVREGKLVGDVLLLRSRKGGSDVSFLINVIWAQVDRPRLRERQIQLELPGPERQRVLRQFHEPSDVDELEISVSQSTRAVVTGDAEVVIHPECDVASEVSRGKNAEKSGLEIRGGNQPGHGARSGPRIEVAPI